MAKEKKETILSKQDIHRTKAKLCAGVSGCKPTENNGEVTADSSAQFGPWNLQYGTIWRILFTCSPSKWEAAKCVKCICMGFF